LNGIVPFLGRWNALPRTVRLGAGAACSIVLVLAICATIAKHSARVALFASPLYAEQRAEVEERLAAWSVPFTPASDNVSVDARRRADLLLRLSLAGVPRAHLTSTGEALATIGVLTPQAVIEAQTRAGLAGDIESGLRGIDGVDDARVIVAPAKTAEFADESRHDASASVRLRLHPGAQLSRQAIGGIRAFVAASVPELESARVTILDDRGVALGDDALMSDDAADLQRSLQSALDAAFGEGAAIVRVRAEYDAARRSARDVRRAPSGASAIAGTRRTESYDGNGKRYRHVEEASDRGDETHEAIALISPGALRRLSSAVFIDRARGLDLTKVRALSSAALGYDALRGDTLAVEAVDFRHELTARRNPWWLLYGAVVPILPALVLAVGFVAGLKFGLPPAAAVVQMLVERTIVERATKSAAGFPPARVRSMLEQEPPHAAAAIISALPAATATAVLELYPPHEREAIVNRMQRRHPPLISNPEELLRRGC
jgi:flagellar biosynthesis/type III secretory pathway M-ring protein FliF/YscJ